MRVLTFTTLFPNSADPTHCVFVYQRLVHLAQMAGNEAVVVSPVPYVPRWITARRWRAQRDLPREEKIGPLTVYHPRYFLLPKIWMPVHALCMFLGSLFCVIRINRSAQINCIDAHFVYPDGLAGILLGKFLNVPVTISARGTDINLYPSFRLIRPMICWALNQADKVIAVSAALKEAMITLGVDAHKIEVIPNGIDANRFYPVPSSLARQKLNLPERGELIVSVGALIPLKGHELLIRAFARIVPRHPGLRMYILGEGPFRGKLERLVAEIGMKEFVFLSGKKANEELRLWFSAADLSCLTSSREGWPNVISESLACGTPVVATRVGGVTEIIQSPELGILVDQTVESVAEGLEQALSKRWDRQAIATKALARTWDIVAAEINAIFASVLAARAQCTSSSANERSRPS